MGRGGYRGRRVNMSVYWSYIIVSYNGTLIPIILMAQIIFQLLQIISNYRVAWETPTKENESSPVRNSLLILIYVALKLRSSLCVLVSFMLLSLVGLKTGNFSSKC